jgi:UV DNA damage repair endonuclease
MFTSPRIGFACKYVQAHPKKLYENVEGFNTGATTVAWLSRQSRGEAEQRLWDLMIKNIDAVQALVKRVGEYDETHRMVRLGSDILPVYTHRDWREFWRRPDVRSECERRFAAVGDMARERDVRLSFHPGQFCVLASESEGIVNNSIEEFEYHADMARWMGYGKRFQDFKINVHIAGKRGPAGILDVLGRLSPEARNCITIENDEMSWGIESSLELADHLALVLDIHHHWINSAGEYITPKDPRFQRVRDSWRGVRPVVHYSVSREDVLIDHCSNTRPDFQSLLAQGHKKAKLRAHSDFYWNRAVNEWAAEFSEYADIMCESKAKNLARDDFSSYVFR